MSDNPVTPPLEFIAHQQSLMLEEIASLRHDLALLLAASVRQEATLKMLLSALASGSKPNRDS